MSVLDLKTLKLKRRNIHSSLKRLRNYLDTHEAIEVTHLQTREVKLQNLCDQFEEIQTNIEVEEEFTTQDEEREQFENEYYCLASRIKDLLKTENRESTCSTNSAMSGSLEPFSRGCVKLPTINLPTFSGDYDQWFPFYDTFKSLIHQNESISEIQKFQYLKTSLTDAAATTLQSLEISASNYKEAWQMLIDRYDNKRLIVHKHIQAMHELSPALKESHTHIRPLLDGVLKHFRALTSLKRPTQHWDDLLIYLITSKLDLSTRKEWETCVSSNEFPLFKELTDFLARKCNTLETTSKTSKLVNVNTNSRTLPVKGSSSYMLTKKSSCAFCGGNHNIYRCNKLLSQSVDERIQQIKSKRLCYNCLQASHSAAQCKASSCRTCNKRHHSLLHLAKQEAMPSTELDYISPIPSTSVSNHSASFHLATQILLSTALIRVYDSKGKEHMARALLDSGSQSNLVTKKLAAKLSLPQSTSRVSITGINQTVSQVTQSIKPKIKSMHSEFETEIECLVLNNISERLPQISFSTCGWRIPKNIRLADPNFHVSSSIDLLIGADLFFKLMCIGRIELGKNQPVLQKTLVGWVVSGRVSPFQSSPQTSCNFLTMSRLERQVAQFWEIENLSPHTSLLSPIERACEEYFMQTHSRNLEGRFIVSMPVKPNPPPLGQSRDQAVKRFQSLEKRLDKDLNLKLEYSKFLTEYLELGHMKKLGREEAAQVTIPHFYLPHHAVVKDSSLTTRLRVVFDGSAKSSSGFSLNDTLMVGPRLQQDLFEIVSRFRTHKIVVTADIAKMYRQVLINPEETPLQRILWRERSTDAIDTYELTTVTYGTASASYLAIKSLCQLATEEQDKYSIGSRIILRDFYVDDLLTGADSAEEAIVIKKEIIAILAKGGFELRKWSSNHNSIIGTSESSHNHLEFVKLDKCEGISTLGLQWIPECDILQYRVRLRELNKKISKRSVLSSISQIFDPLGLIAPVIITAKIFMQTLWELKLSWEESLPIYQHTFWLQYEKELQDINQIKIPRCVIGVGKAIIIEIHGFCDASEKAYGACVYIRVEDTEGKVTCKLLCSKSRVAPLKVISLPRLELCGALLLAQLTGKLRRSLNLPLDRTFYWTDSSVVLAWLKQPSKTWKTFVANRVSEIQEFSNPNDWYHVGTNDNPADILSRGSNPKSLQDSPLWWAGPQWLRNDMSTWPIQLEGTTENQEMLEKRPIHITTMSTFTTIDWFAKYSDLSRMIRIVAYCQRFKNNLVARQFHDEKRIETGPLTCNHLNIATKTLVKIVQGEVFSDDLLNLDRSGRVNQKSKLIQLNPFSDEEGILRVGGRLRNSSLPYNAKHPILLPSKHSFTRLLVKREHIKQLHAGVQTTLAVIRSNYWILSSRNCVKSVIRNCMICFKAKPSVTSLPMGDLPTNRISASRPFQNVGIDYFGPLQLKEGKRRNSPKVKAYGAIFVCFSTKAIHLELVGNLSTECFISALRRFISRRGKPATIYSDNGTQFVGAKRELNELAKLVNSQDSQIKIQNVVSEENVNWIFSPPRAPHFGGLWEAAVKSAKHHLSRILGNTSLNFEEMYTLLVQIESILNSRPLTALSNDPNDLTFLTPAHFLIGDSLMAVPEPTLSDVNLNTLSRWQYIQQVREHFWRRWSKEYLHQLQTRHRWNVPIGRQLEPGDLVLIREDNVPPLKWPIGKILEVFPGKDGIVRVASLKTSRGVFRRAAVKLCRLPMD